MQTHQMIRQLDFVTTTTTVPGNNPHKRRFSHHLLNILYKCLVLSIVFMLISFAQMATADTASELGAIATYRLQ